MCDELGIVVWEETLGPGTGISNYQDPYFMQVGDWLGRGWLVGWPGKELGVRALSVCS
jgi:hypothetical protein